jgi:hypothetical protein
MAGLEITRIASQFAIQYMSVAMQLKFCIAVGCDAKLLKPHTVINNYAVFLSIYSSHLKFSTVFLIAENAFCHSATIPFRKMYAVDPDQTLRRSSLPGLHVTLFTVTEQVSACISHQA